MTSEPTLQVKNLTKRFGSVLAVDDLSFDVMPGRVTGFLGPNGAGKTTTLKLLLDLVRPTSGIALVKGQNYSKLDRPMRVVGAHLDSGSFNPGRTGRDHMLVAAAEGNAGTDRIDELLDLVSMTDSANRRMGQYSLGMQQRLGLATALIGDPEILVLDEPANGLDPEGIRWLREFLRAFAAEGRTVLLSSHLLGEIQLMAHDVVIINRGRLVAAGSVQELESLRESVVLVDSTNPEGLWSALQAGGLTVSLTKPDNGRAEPIARMSVTGTSVEEVGLVALNAGVPLSHLSERTSGLEDLFMDAVGGAR